MVSVRLFGWRATTRMQNKEIQELTRPEEYQQNNSISPRAKKRIWHEAHMDVDSDFPSAKIDGDTLDKPAIRVLKGPEEVHSLLSLPGNPIQIEIFDVT